MSVKISSIGRFEDNSGSSTTSLELIRKAAMPCIENSAYKKEDIGVLINVSVYRDNYFCEPAFASFVQNDLGINHDKEDSSEPKTLSFDLLNGAMGFLNACQVVDAMADAGRVKAGLIVSGDVIDYEMNEKSDNSGFILSGAAMILGKNGRNDSGFGPFYFRTFAELQDTYESFISFKNKRLTMMFRKSPDIENIYLDAISRGLEEFLTREKLRMDDFDWIVPQQISPGFVDALGEFLGIESSRMVNVARRDSDLFNASLPSAIGHLTDNGLAKNGDNALIIGVGSGIQVGCTTYRF